MGVIAILLKNRSLVGLGVLLLALAGTGIYIKVLKGEVSTLTAEKNTLIAEKNTLKMELVLSQDSVKKLQLAVDEQNTAIKKLKDDADARLVAHQVEIKKAKDKAASYKKLADELMNLVPAPGKPICDEANALINKEINSEK